MQTAIGKNGSSTTAEAQFPMPFNPMYPKFTSPTAVAPPTTHHKQLGYNAATNHVRFCLSLLRAKRHLEPAQKRAPLFRRLVAAFLLKMVAQRQQRPMVQRFNGPFAAPHNIADLRIRQIFHKLQL